VLGLVTSEFLYRLYPNEHEGHLTKIKSLLVSKAILSRRALAMGLGRFVLMSHSEVESGGRQRLSILADAFEAVLGAIYLDQGFEAAREFIDRWLLRDSSAITSDERHVNYKSHLQEYVQSTYHTHPVYRIRSEYGPDHSKHFNVDVMVGRRVLGSGKGRNKKEAEQAAARGALDQAGALPRMPDRPERPDFDDVEDVATLPRRRAEELDEPGEAEPEDADDPGEAPEERRSRRRGRRGGRGRRSREGGREMAAGSDFSVPRAGEPRESGEESRMRPTAIEPPRPSSRPWRAPDDEFEEIGRPDGPLEERHVDPYDWEGRTPARPESPGSASEEEPFKATSSRRVDFGSRLSEEPEAAEEEERPSARAPAANRGEDATAREKTSAPVNEKREPETPAPPPRPAREVQFGRRGTRARTRPGGR
jgi:ribonuclease-3